jgi:hypothetical protein
LRRPTWLQFRLNIVSSRQKKQLREFRTFTGDLHRLADGLAPCAVKTVAMECASSEGWRVQREESPVQARARSLVAWMAGRRETNDLKPIDRDVHDHPVEKRCSPNPTSKTSEASSDHRAPGPRVRLTRLAPPPPRFVQAGAASSRVPSIVRSKRMKTVGIGVVFVRRDCAESE